MKKVVKVDRLDKIVELTVGGLVGGALAIAILVILVQFFLAFADGFLSAFI
jgi:hypothetical protein